MPSPPLPGSTGQHVLILGAYGLIGYAVAMRLTQLGYRLTGLGRDQRTAKRVLPNLTWTIKDMGALSNADDWKAILTDVSAVVNCSGALQDGPDDDLEMVHHRSIAALASACVEKSIKLIQISAVGAATDAASQFMASKARGDAAVRNSGAEYVIFRPGLVLAPHAYGGTAMLRMLAAIPLVQPLSMPEARVQTIAVGDVAEAISAALDGSVPAGFEGDLVEEKAHGLRDVVAAMREWLGFSAATREITMPDLAVRTMARIADGLSWLGWRSPLRTTSISVLGNGVTGNPAKWSALKLFPISSMAQTFSAMQATTEHRLAARMALLMPLLVVGLFVFWLASGLIGLIFINEAAAVLEAVGWSPLLAKGSVAFWAMLDIAIAVAVAFRKTARAACWAMVAVSCLYLVASTLFVPHLWGDPLGPLVKIIPSILLAMVTRIALEAR